MSETIKWTTNLAVSNGPSFAFTDKVLVDAYEKLQVEVKKEAASTVPVSLLPEDVDATVLVIAASAYRKEGEDKTVTYILGSDTTAKVLAGAIVLTNASAVQDMLGANKTITFTNNLTVDIIVDILVGREAGPSAP